MSSNRRFRRWFITAVLLAPLALLAWTPAGNAATDKGKDCVSCHKHKRGAAGTVRTESLRAGAGVGSPHGKRSSAGRAKGGKGTDNTMSSPPVGRPTPRNVPSGKPVDLTPGTTIKR
jgi:hypothetical protein